MGEVYFFFTFFEVEVKGDGVKTVRTLVIGILILNVLYVFAASFPSGKFFWFTLAIGVCFFDCGAGRNVQSEYLETILIQGFSFIQVNQIYFDFCFPFEI